MVFVAAALIMVPIMLLVKPLHFKFTHKEEHAHVEGNAALEANQHQD